MPNYNLGPVPIYQLDTPQLQYTICHADTVQLGIADTLSEVAYHWQSAVGGWQSIQMLPQVSPDSSTIYYLTRTDTAASYSCNVRHDTITVTVRMPDTTSIDTALATGTAWWGVTITQDTVLWKTYKRPGCDSTVKATLHVLSGAAPIGAGPATLQVWPHPAGQTLQIHYAYTGQPAPLHFRLYNLLGQPVLQATLRQPVTRLSTAALPEGVYLWEAMPTQPGSRKPVRGKVCLVQ